MRFSYSWLRDYLETNETPERIGEVLTDLGLEIESLINPKTRLMDLTVGEILSFDKHPNADKLQVCRVKTSDNTLNIICGAPNVKTGMKVVVAKPGNFIPGLNITLKKSEIRGVQSDGMMCSEKELEISDEHDGIIELPKDTEVGTLYSSLVDENKICFEIAITPNRPDALGVFGIARDLAARGVGVLKVAKHETFEEDFVSNQSIELDESVKGKECPFFVGRSLKNVRNGESPQWLKQRLKSIGLKPISALVDITNYITFDRGRPLHVFDADKIIGNLKVRKSVAGEKFHALDEKIYNLEEGMTVIVDDKEIISLGGIIGGLNSSVSSETKNVLLEAAYFEPISIASTGRKLKINSDARYRFERGIDPSFTIPGNTIATKMILDICGGSASKLIIAGGDPKPNKEVFFNPQKVNDLIGIKINFEDQKSILTSLGFIVDDHKKKIIVKVPSWRPDIHGEADLVEEIARVSSLANLPSTPLYRDAPGVMKPILTRKQSREGVAKRICASLGYVECVSYSFLDEFASRKFNSGKDEVLLSNPISSEMTNMRNSIVPGLIRIIERNQARGSSDMALFELGQCFLSNKVGDESSEISGVLTGNNYSNSLYKNTRIYDVFDIKRDLIELLNAMGLGFEKLKMSRDTPHFLHSGRSAKLSLGSKCIAIYGEISPLFLKDFSIKGRVNCFTVFLENIPISKNKKISRNPLIINTLQAVERDFSFMVDQRSEYENIKQAIFSLKNDLIEQVTIFDVFSGKEELETEKKSLSVRVKIQPKSSTLKDHEIDKICKEIIGVVGSKVGGLLRG